MVRQEKKYKLKNNIALLKKAYNTTMMINGQIIIYNA